ncbi:MAG: hypothetical protein KatS3mg076_3034 [Candidatus Binatia bacterium]|nr:MAG: hypothetical protein KatS3mg076_3034 [Candidatus Binatia bacterium]
MKRRARLLWWTFGFLFAASVPWYVPSGLVEPLVFGFPFWSLLPLCCYVLAAALASSTLDVLWEDTEKAAGTSREP